MQHTGDENGELFWTATRYADVLRLDRRRVAAALEKATSTTQNGRRVWRLRDGMRAIFGGADVADTPRQNPSDMEPRDELDYYRAQRERLRLAEDIGQACLADDMRSVFTVATAAIGQVLNELPAELEAQCALPSAVVASIRQTLTAAASVLEQTLAGHHDDD